MGRQGRAGRWVAGILILGITAYSAGKLIGTGVLSWHITQREYHAMMAELLLVWLLLFGLFRFGRNTRSVWGGAVVLTAVITWCHVIFLPVVFGGCYMAYLILVGRWLTKSNFQTRSGVCQEFLLGSAMTIFVFCLLSLIKAGSIRNLRLWVLASLVLLLLREWREWRQKTAVPGGTERLQQKITVPGGTELLQQKEFPLKRGGAYDSQVAAMLASVLVLLLLQACRLNLAVDFDSLWYGVRSHVMLDSGSGIYENLGTLGVVYTYSKGWEVLTLPLAGLPSYSFSTAMNLWVAGLTLLALYETAALCLDWEKALWAPFLAASVPGIMNMSGTAKADMMTLFCQILMVQALLRYGREEKAGTAECLLPGLAAGMVSLAMKPTAVVFTTALAGVGVLWLFLKRFGSEPQRAARHTVFRGGDTLAGNDAHLSENDFRAYWLFPAIAFGSLAGIWGRTWYLVGVPVTSVFYQIFQKLGFEVKYPFYASGFPSAGGSMAFGEKLGFLLRRLYGVLLNPQGEDMAHVIIAWGGVLPLVFFLLFLCHRLTAGKEERKQKGGGELTFLALLLAALLFIDLVSLYSLSQIDGNYYMLTYAIVILAGCIWLDQSGSQWQRMGRRLLIPAWCYGMLLCGLTNWAWVLGNGGIRPVNKGYYPHIQAEREKRAMQGSAAIWDILAQDPKTRVIALGEHPGVLAFPCWVQSYVDVSGYWGNPEVVANAPNFLEYLWYADVDYLYMEKEYVDSSVRIYQIVRTLIQEGALHDVRDENGNLILSVCREGEGCSREEVEKNLQVFDTRYVQHP